jgi:hypothetical protein
MGPGVGSMCASLAIARQHWVYKVGIDLTPGPAGVVL